MAQDPGRTLVLFRHAKSAWPDVADHERPLARRGIEAAPVMGRWLRDAGLVPDQVLCSTARRARETWQFAQAGMAGTPLPVTFDGRIYEASAMDLLAVIREARPAARTLLLIGHNPGIADLALLLAAPAGACPGTTGPGTTGPGTTAPGTTGPGTTGPGTTGPGTTAPGTTVLADLERMRAKFPTAAVAVLRSAGDWPRLGGGRARLTAFVTPRDLGAGER